MDSVAPAASITWHVGNSDDSISHLSETEVQVDGSVSARSSVRLPSSLYSGQNVTCMVQHPSLEAPERRTIQILVHSTLFLSSRYFSLCDTHTCTHTQSRTAAHHPFLSPLLSSFRSPSAQCVCGEAAGLCPLAGSVRLQRGWRRDEPRLGPSRKRQEPDIPALRVRGPLPESQADLSVSSGPSRGPEPDL